MKMKKLETMLVAAVLVVCAVAGFYVYRPGKATDVVALISVDSKECYLVDLSANEEPFTFRIEQETGKPVSFEVKDHAIRFVEVLCPDHVCEKAGWCRTTGDRAVCLPNRTTLVCYEKQELPKDTDARRITPDALARVPA